MLDVKAWIDKRMAERQREQEIHCPYCDALYPNDDNQYPVSYWGDSDVEELECQECEQKFYAAEYVERTYESGKYRAKLGGVTDEEKEKAGDK